MMTDPLEKFLSVLPVPQSMGAEEEIVEFIITRYYDPYYFWVFIPTDVDMAEMYLYRYDKHETVIEFIEEMIDSNEVNAYFMDHCDSYDLVYEVVDLIDIDKNGLKPIVKGNDHG